MSGNKKSSMRTCTRDSPVFWRRFLLDRAKLKATSRTSALLSGFAMIAMVELQLNSSPTPAEKCSYVIFAVITTLLIATHMFSLLISTCILPSLEVASAGAAGMPRELRSSLSPASTPYQSMRIFIEVAWVCSTGFGILLFFVEVGILSWVKFQKAANVAAYVSIGLVIPLFIIFTVFAFKFYREMVGEKLEEDDVLIAQLIHLRDKIERCERQDEEECRQESFKRTHFDDDDGDDFDMGGGGGAAAAAETVVNMDGGIVDDSDPIKKISGGETLSI